MASFDVAHVRVQGSDVILIVVDSAFGHKSKSEQDEALAGFRLAANHAGLRGGVAVVWNQGGRVMSFGPQNWQGFLRGLTWPWIAANINRKLTTG
jgi:hypothetical protein